MGSKRRDAIVLAVLVALTAAALPAPGAAGIGDRIKKKLGDKATKKAEEAIGGATGEAGDGTTGQTSGADDPGDGGGRPGGDPSKVSGVSTRFDYVPGDSVLFADDFTQDDLGEFPARWRLLEGTFEIAEMAGERWLRCTSANGHVRMKVPAGLPQFWTLEFDYWCEKSAGQVALDVTGLAAGGGTAWELRYPLSGEYLGFRSGTVDALTKVGGAIDGRHHVMLMARGRAIKAYLDRERLASVPEIATSSGEPVEIDFRLGANSPPMIGRVRFAEGPRPARDLLAEGRLVTYGIHFASGSDVVLPESAPVLRQVASYLEANPAVKLRITGHTDNVGSPADNLDLSKRRAAAVAKVLASQLGVAADRFETDGKGDTQAVAGNAKPEGRAMNRRVEFAKR